jgi:alkylation response protein AidB-like acyl-CoA dehydrogenase
MKPRIPQLFFDNVKVPKENRLGDEKMVLKS